MELTIEQLRLIAPTMPLNVAEQNIDALNEAMERYEINTPARVAAFLAQILHESGGFHWFEEIWGPTPAQKKYEPPSKMAKSLGNTEPGDGKRFKGRGAIQLTGRTNYRLYGSLLEVDLIADPELAATPKYRFLIAGLYWRKNELNAMADRNNENAFKQITRRINGGLNGLADRLNYWNKARLTLGTD